MMRQIWLIAVLALARTPGYAVAQSLTPAGGQVQQAPTSGAAAIKDTFARFERALKDMSYKALVPLCTPDFLDVHDNTTVTIENWKHTFALMKQAGGKIRFMRMIPGKPLVQGDSATVPAKRITEILLRNPQTQKIDTLGEVCTYRMTMARIGGKWKLRKMETLELKLKVNGKPKPD